MNWSILNKLELDVWYRGNKTIKPIKITDTYIKYSNNDIIKFSNGLLYFNNQLISNLQDITEKEIYTLYLEYLTKKNYKILNNEKY